jgi:hypothetical protein
LYVLPLKPYTPRNVPRRQKVLPFQSNGGNFATAACVKDHAPRIAFLETRQIIALPVSESNQKENPGALHFATARETDETRATSRTPDFQEGLYIPKTYHIEPFTLIF